MAERADDSFRDDFDGADLDAEAWFPYYLPHWSSRDDAAAVYEITPEGLRLWIPTDHPLWCAERHPTPIRISGIASGEYAGAVGTTHGAQPFADDLTVQEAQPRFEGRLLTGGHLEIRCKMELSHRSMAALWLAGFEDEPHRSGEICVFEVFGKDVESGCSAEIGVGHKQLRDPDLAHDFDAPTLDLDIAELHTYAVDYDAHESEFSVDGSAIKRCSNPQTPADGVRIGPREPVRSSRDRRVTYAGPRWVMSSRWRGPGCGSTTSSPSHGTVLPPDSLRPLEQRWSVRRR